MNVILDAAPAAGGDRTVLLMLPGAGDRAQDLVDQGFVRCLRRRRLAVDVLVADARFDDYLENSVVAQLERDVVAPVRAQGHARLWLMGISLGGLGALSYAREHTRAVEGVILLAPFLGTRGLVAEIIRAGGLGRWQSGTIAPTDAESLTLAWLAQYRAGDPVLPRIYLGYGSGDRYAAASEMLERQLPRDQVVSVPGGHDWATWLLLWERLLDAGILSGSDPARLPVPPREAHTR